jgi:hypothetical protein
MRLESPMQFFSRLRGQFDFLTSSRRSLVGWSRYDDRVRRWRHCDEMMQYTVLADNGARTLHWQAVGHYLGPRDETEIGARVRVVLWLTDRNPSTLVIGRIVEMKKKLQSQSVHRQTTESTQAAAAAARAWKCDNKQVKHLLHGILKGILAWKSVYVLFGPDRWNLAWNGIAKVATAWTASPVEIFRQSTVCPIVHVGRYHLV